MREKVIEGFFREVFGNCYGEFRDHAERTWIRDENQYPLVQVQGQTKKELNII